MSTGLTFTGSRGPGRRPCHRSTAATAPSLLGVGGGLVEPVDPAAHGAAGAALLARAATEPAGEPEIAEEDGERRSGHRPRTVRPGHRGGSRRPRRSRRSVPDRVGPELDPDDEHEDEEDRDDDGERRCQICGGSPATGAVSVLRTGRTGRAGSAAAATTAAGSGPAVGWARGSFSPSSVESGSSAEARAASSSLRGSSSGGSPSSAGSACRKRSALGFGLTAPELLR